MSLEAKAVARWVRIAPRKMRLVVNMVRGEGVRSAVNTLHFSQKRASEPVSKTIRSALANLMIKEEAAKLDPSNVYIKEIWVDEGPIQRRWRPRAMGRASRIRKRTSHLTVVVAARDKAAVQK
ncbi:50S ribosomal protein L22 [bacterium]|nr:50S ribosomal protein L22 [bacterium]